DFHQTWAASAAGSAKMSRKIGSSSRTVYPARLTPIHRFTTAATSQSAMKSFAPTADHSGRPASLGSKTNAARMARPMAMMMTVRMTSFSVQRPRYAWRTRSSCSRAAPVQHADGMQHVLHHERSEAERGLVEHDELGLAGEAAADREHLLLAARE